MAKPTFVQNTETVWNTTTSPKTTGSFAVQTNDILVACVNAESSGGASSVAISDSQTPDLPWTLRQEVDVLGYSWVAIWTAVADFTGNLTVTATASFDGSYQWGLGVMSFRASDGVGASAKTNVASGAPSLALTTTQNNSAVFSIIGDWNAAAGARTWRTINSITPTVANGLVTEDNQTLPSYLYICYWDDAGTAGSVTTGMTAPTTQKYSIASIEIKGTAAAAASPVDDEMNQGGIAAMIAADY